MCRRYIIENKKENKDISIGKYLIKRKENNGKQLNHNK